MIHIERVVLVWPVAVSIMPVGVLLSVWVDVLVSQRWVRLSGGVWRGARLVAELP